MPPNMGIPHGEFPMGRTIKKLLPPKGNSFTWNGGVRERGGGKGCNPLPFKEYWKHMYVYTFKRISIRLNTFYTCLNACHIDTLHMYLYSFLKHVMA